MVMRKEHLRFVVQTTAVYAVVAGLWIGFSDWVLAWLVPDARRLTELAMVKGWFFVIVTALLLYGLLSRAMRQLQRKTEAQEQAQTELRQWADAFTNCAHGLALGEPGSERIIACNPAFARLHGRQAADIAGRPILEVYAPADHAHVRAAIAEADRSGHVQYEARMRRADDSTFPVQMDVVSVRGADDRILYRVATAQDISARQAAETTTRQSEHRLRTIVESLTEGLLITDLAGEPLLWNRAFLQMQQLDDTAETRRALPDFRQLLELTTLEGRVLAPAERPLARVLRGETLDDVWYRVRHVGRPEVRTFSFHGSIVQDPAGRGMALITNTDVTARTLALEALRESEQRFRAVVENIHEVFWMRDPVTNRILYVSPAYETVWGRPSAELTGASAEVWLETIHPEDRERVRGAMMSSPMPLRSDTEYRILRPDGALRWVRDQAFPVPGDQGRADRIVGVAEDITERKQLEAQFLRAQRMEAIGTLAGGIAHDLNNILAPMLMAAGLLKERITDARDRDMLAMVERSARRGADIIRQLLTFSRGVEGARGTVQLRHLVKEMGAIIRETFPREISFVEIVPRDLWTVVADATQLHQVLVNLTVNARDAMPDGGTLTISADNETFTAEDPQLPRGARLGRYVKITVADTGTGMPATVVERIFDPFFTTKEPGKGTGLGLSTVLGIVRSHGGLITVESEAGQGSAFHVHLPAAPANAEEEPLPAVEPLPTGHGEVVLVVDDEEPIRESTRHVLEQQGFRVLTAANGKEALTAFVAQRDEIRVVLTDMMMPQMGGVALVRALLLIRPGLRVIATSGLGEGTRVEELQALGIYDVLPKPGGPKALLDAIRRALDAERA